MSDTPLKSLVKTISWRLIAIIVSFFSLYAWTKDFYLSMSLTMGLNVAKTITYYLHERLWAKIKWGS